MLTYLYTSQAGLILGVAQQTSAVPTGKYSFRLRAHALLLRSLMEAGTYIFGGSFSYLHGCHTKPWLRWHLSETAELACSWENVSCGRTSLNIFNSFSSAVWLEEAAGRPYGAQHPWGLPRQETSLMASALLCSTCILWHKTTGVWWSESDCRNALHLSNSPVGWPVLKMCLHRLGLRGRRKREEGEG